MPLSVLAAAAAAAPERGRMEADRDTAQFMTLWSVANCVWGRCGQSRPRYSLTRFIPIPTQNSDYVAPSLCQGMYQAAFNLLQHSMTASEVSLSVPIMSVHYLCLCDQVYNDSTTLLECLIQLAHLTLLENRPDKAITFLLKAQVCQTCTCICTQYDIKSLLSIIRSCCVAHSSVWRWWPCLVKLRTCFLKEKEMRNCFQQ